MAHKISMTYRRIDDFLPDSHSTNSFVYDTDTPGLRLKITTAGKKVFEFYSWDKKEQKPVRITIATYNGKNLDEARTVAKRYAAAMTEGRDIETEQRGAREEKDFDHHFNLWLDDQRRLGHKDVVPVESRYKSHILPTIGRKKISWFTEERLAKWLLDLPNRPSRRGNNLDGGTISRATSNRCLQVVKRVFSHRSLKYVENPAKGVEQFKEISRSRYAKPDELRRLFDALPFSTPIFADVVRMALFTGARKENLLSMQWRDIDLASGTWTIPGELSKNDEAMSIPLLDDAILLLKRRKEEQKSNMTITPYVFPGNGKKGHLEDVKRQWDTLLRRAEISGNLRFHDLRRSVGSYMAQSGQPLTVIAAILGHKDLRTTEIYARLNRRAAIDGLKAGMEHMLEQADKIKSIR